MGSSVSKVLTSEKYECSSLKKVEIQQARAKPPKNKSNQSSAELRIETKAFSKVIRETLVTAKEREKRSFNVP
jgi:translation initiation factor 2B subunit (eIF-2B alpha/beta/delta family)